MRHALWFGMKVVPGAMPAARMRFAACARYSTGARRYIAPQELERVAKRLGHAPDEPLHDALTMYLRTSRDARMRRTASTALASLAQRPVLDAPLVSLALAAKLAVSDGRVLDILSELQEAHPAWKPTAADYTHLLHTLCRQRDADALLVWDTMRAENIHVPMNAVNATIATALVHAPMERVRTLLDEAGDIDALDKVGCTSLLQGLCHRYADAHDRSEAFPDTLDGPTLDELHAVALRLHALLQDTNDGVGWHAYLTYVGLCDGPSAATDAAAELVRARTLVPDAWTLSTLALCHAHHAPPQSCDEALECLDMLERAVHIRPGRYVVAMMIQCILGHAVRIGTRRVRATPDPGQTVEAQALYQEARILYNLRPDAALVHPLIEAHCNAFVPAIDAAYALLRDLLPPPRSLLDRWKKPPAPLTDLGTFYPIVMACARLHDIPRALALLKQMDNITIPPHVATTLVLRLWEVCTTFDEAWQVYQAVHAIGQLDEGSYAQLVAACCRLHLYEDPEKEPCSVPPAYPLQILGDMRAAKLHPSPKTYTVLLDYYAKSPRATLAGVHATHELIKRDVHLEPDLVLINTLMNAYSHVDAPAHVLGIWDRLVVLCTNADKLAFMDEVSLVVVLDACGHAGLLSAARRALDTARKLERGRGVLVGKDALDAWIECLARCGRVAEAIDVVFGMPPELPDQKTLETLLRFGASARQRGALSSEMWAALRERIALTFPATYPYVAHIA